MLLLLLACTPPARFDDAQRAAAVAAAAEVDGERLMAHVAALVDGRIAETPYEPPEPRYAGMTFTHVNSAEYVRSQLAQELGLTASEFVSGEGDRRGYSVWADLPGATRPDEVVLLSAHHDAWYFGADDNATGVAVILECARALADAGLDRTVRIISFDREEEGLVGAAAYASANPDAGLYRVVNLDSVGYTDSTPGSQQSILGLDAPDTADFLALIAAQGSKGDLEAAMAVAGELPDPVKLTGVLANDRSHGALLSDLLRSDHAPFWAQGIGGLFLTDTTEFRNPRYHTPEDTIDTLDPAFLAQVGGFTCGVTAAFATAGGGS